MNSKQQQIEQTQKNIILVLILGIIAIGLIGFYAFSRYITAVKGTGEAQIAKWSFIVNGQSSDEEEIDLNLTINPNNNVASGKVAPGTSGSFEIEIDATKSEVALSYAIEMNLEQTPHNLILYSDYIEGEYKNPITVADNTAIIKGYMSLEDVKTVKKQKIYWDWPYETPTPEGQEKSNDEIDTEDSGKTMKIGVTVTGTQVLEVPVYAKDVLKTDENGELKTPYVKYIDKNGDERLCRVLYNDEEHGLQIITEGSVENVFLGYNDENYKEGSDTDLQKTQNSYNNAIENLNKKAESYKNEEIVVDARCVGSVATAKEEKFNNKNSETLEDTSFKQYKGTDEHYKEDYDTMETLGILGVSGGYWLASRDVNSSAGYKCFSIRYAGNTGILSTFFMFSIYGCSPTQPSIGFRPVFLLESNVEVIKGDGKTPKTAFELGIN